MKAPEFIGMTLGDLLAEFDHCKNKWHEAASAPQLSWSELRAVGCRACYVSQCIHLRISEVWRQQDMRCEDAVAMFKDFVDEVKTVLSHFAINRPAEYNDLWTSATNIETRIGCLNELTKRTVETEADFAALTGPLSQDHGKTCEVDHSYRTSPSLNPKPR